MFDVISFGAATADIFIKSKDIIVKDDPQFEGGQSLSLAYSSKNEIDQSLICSGGGATNSAVSFSRLGLKSSCVSLIGADFLSGYITRDLDSDNVDRSLLVESSTENTDFSVVLVAADGGRSILTDRGTTTLQESDIDWDKIKDTKWFYITSLEGNLDLLEKIIGFAEEHNINVSLNPGNRELARPDRLKPLLPFVNFLLLNRTESESLVGVSTKDSKFWDKIISLGCPISSVTDGRDGAYIATSQGKLYSPIINVTPVDETGAGDSFGSAVVAAIIHQHPLSEALNWGIRNSASAVSIMGAKTGMLKLSEIST
jgi:sugar/nucleoside kinase (ribokinase family)